MRRTTKKAILSTAVTGLLAGSALAGGEFSDDFESYNVGQGLDGVNGWSIWQCGNGTDGVILNDQAHSGTKSFHVNDFDDVVQEFDICSGVWEVSAWTYVPEQFGDTFFIMLNTYNCPGDPPLNWSVQVHFAGFDQEVIAEGGNSETTALVFDEWVQIRVVVDLDNDTHDIYYGDTLLVDDRSWTEGVSGGGQTCFQAIDLFSNGSEEGIYFDDVVVQEAGPSDQVATITECSLVSGSDPENNGCDPANLADNDDVVERLRSQPGFSAFEPYITEIDMIADAGSATSLASVLVRDSGLLGSNMVGKVRVFNYATNSFQQVGSYSVSSGGLGTDTEHVVSVGSSDYVSGTGEVNVRIRYVSPATFVATGFDVYLDQVQLLVN